MEFQVFQAIIWGIDRCFCCLNMLPLVTQQKERILAKYWDLAVT